MMLVVGQMKVSEVGLERTCLPALTHGRAPFGFGVASWSMMQDDASSACENTS